MTALLALLRANWRLVAGVLIVLAASLAIYGKGRNDERVKWEKKAQAALAAAAKETQRLVEKNYVIEQRVIATVQRERVVTRNIIEQVPVYVPADSCPLPAGFRLLHDAAARGVDPAAPGGTDAAPVGAQDATSTVVENYGTCREDQARLAALQEWARTIANTPILCPQ